LIKTLQNTIRLLLYVAGSLAMLVAVHRAWGFISRGFPDLSGCAIHYTSLQVGMLNDVAKTLIPSASGLIAIVGAAAGYLHKERLLVMKAFQIGVFGIFALAIISLGCWVGVLATTVDAAGMFNGDHSLVRDWVQICPWGVFSYRAALVAAQVGACTFFAAFAVVGILGLEFVERRPPVPAAPLVP
jgi:hypothetical protein